MDTEQQILTWEMLIETAKELERLVETDGTSRSEIKMVVGELVILVERADRAPARSHPYERPDEKPKDETKGRRTKENAETERVDAAAQTTTSVFRMKDAYTQHRGKDEAHVGTTVQERSNTEAPNDKRVKANRRRKRIKE